MEILNLINITKMFHRIMNGLLLCSEGRPLTALKSKVIWSLCFLYSVSTVAQEPNSQELSGTFRGEVVATVYEIPMKSIIGARGMMEHPTKLPGSKKMETVTFSICNDSMYYRSLLEEGGSMELYQYGNKTLLYDQREEGFVVYPKLRALDENAGQQDWKTYQKKRGNPFGFNYVFNNPAHKQFTTYARVDDSQTYSNQLELGGRFCQVFNPHGRYLYKGGIFDDWLALSSYTYFPDSSYNCNELFERVKIVDEVEGEIPKNTVYYEPDTLIDFERDFGFITLEGMYSEEAQSIEIVQLPDTDYTYIEIYAGHGGEYDTQLEYLEELRSKGLFNNIGILSFYVEDTSDPSTFIEAVKERSSLWAHYMFPFGRNSFSWSDLNLTLLPRYIIIDKSKRIIMLNAPRPSDSRLSKVLRQLPSQ